ncbi:MAG: 3-phosphoserine/phosphohydroxythreonine transaminase [Planctomycetota bacterium]|jgi:phosphoserine aminotransferase|nr:3-phosphoserine/phosphohydroxythreonine aminotransferase [Deltaproteobacteria bacterium]MDP6539872.1 3-phosphoserine/phosphohydroxythreonine transaminase [Planctomycetota bacterium]
MTDRIFNFSAGPATLPEEVLRDAQEALWNLHGTGIGVMEHSHRGGAFTAVAQETEAACRALAGIPDDYAVLFLQGGASTQFFQLPAHWLAEDATADYLVTGSWSEKAAKEARRYGKVHEAATTRDQDFGVIPRQDQIHYSDAPTYVHLTSNNTIFGTQWVSEPEIPAEAWLACDASSDIFSRPIDLTRYGVLYAGAQKNLGPAGVTLVVVRRDLLDAPVRDLPTMLRYATHAEQGSLYNTPPSFGIYVMGRVLRWIQEQGGLAGMARANEEKAQVLYDALSELDFYACTAGEGSRSLMNITFRTPTPELDAAFVKEALAAQLSGLKGHRSVGGMRASIYNAFPKEGCEVLASFLRDFAARNG